MCSQQPGQPLTEQRVRLFVKETIGRTKEQGNDPIQQAEESSLHPGPVAPSLHPKMTEEELLEWIMQTEEMTEALTWFGDQNPENPQAWEVEAQRMTEEEVEETDVYMLLLGLTVAESDWM